MAQTYRALAVLLSYPTEETAALMPAVMEALSSELLVPAPIVSRLRSLAEDLESGDLYETQARYVDLFDRTRSLSLQLYEHVHGESRDRGQAMVELLKLYSSHGLELTAKELPDHLPVFLEFLSQRPADEAAALLGQAAHVLEALRERLNKRESIYARVFDALVAIVEAYRNPEALKALLQEPEDNPDDLEALDRAWAEEQVTFGPDKVDCPKAAVLSRMKQEVA
ncbi:MAG TPA: nitrate reductase molybdenum cofactor assembly chaperone [Vitreimonas sp.]|uniref:nitrate reductase molybdenum cofactor assembly chaperone n=1 Tax=Vitreimonas sp. TaxID=3069702 RepID=UPI002D283E5B|nr:nitrate reductase molybdenum cofactor assembly chaperone [Vitreimonas sp.]HYD89306.1 nitrate reductase molybdenum cofactor assembly chaperone [Vitreimonas sp.]